MDVKGIKLSKKKKNNQSQRSYINDENYRDGEQISGFRGVGTMVGGGIVTIKGVSQGTSLMMEYFYILMATHKSTRGKMAQNSTQASCHSLYDLCIYNYFKIKF